MAGGMGGRRSSGLLADGSVGGARSFCPPSSPGFLGGIEERSKKQGEHTAEGQNPPASKTTPLWSPFKIRG